MVPGDPNTQPNDSEERAVVICITPVRNEAWILERFLQCASLWADHIIIVDQNSDDGSRELAARHPKVTILDYSAEEFSEVQRRSLLISEAQRIPGKRLIVALDADEANSANWMHSPEWSTVLRTPRGTAIKFGWANLLPGLETCWIPETTTYALMDDGSEFPAIPIHGPRLPTPSGTVPSLVLRDLKVLHYMCADWERMMSKQRWYQCWERIHSPRLRPIPLYRRYHHIHAIHPSEILPVPADWFEGYERLHIDMKTIATQEVYRWDGEVLRFLKEYGPKRFGKIDIWDMDWTEVNRKLGGCIPDEKLRDPRGPIHRIIHRWLRATQLRMSDRKIRFVQRA